MNNKIHSGLYSKWNQNGITGIQIWHHWGINCGNFRYPHWIQWKDLRKIFRKKSFSNIEIGNKQQLPQESLHRQYNFYQINSLSLVMRLGHSSFPVIPQSWQSWHFCTTSNENKLEVVGNGINFIGNLCLSRCFKLKFRWLHLIFWIKAIQKCQHCQLCVITGKLDLAT